MAITRRGMLTAAPAGVAVALAATTPASAGPTPARRDEPAAAPPTQADWLVALRSGLAPRGTP